MELRQLEREVFYAASGGDAAELKRLLEATPPVSISWKGDVRTAPPRLDGKLSARRRRFPLLPCTNHARPPSLPRLAVQHSLTAVQAACMNGHAECLRLLIKHGGADITSAMPVRRRPPARSRRMLLLSAPTLCDLPRSPRPQ